MQFFSLQFDISNWNSRRSWFWWKPALNTCPTCEQGIMYIDPPHSHDLSDKSIFSPPQISIFWSNEPISANQCALTANIPPGIAGVWKGSLRKAFKMVFIIVWRFDLIWKFDSWIIFESQAHCSIEMICWSWEPLKIQAPIESTYINIISKTDWTQNLCVADAELKCQEARSPN